MNRTILLANSQLRFFYAMVASGSARGTSSQLTGYAHSLIGPIDILPWFNTSRRQYEASSETLLVRHVPNSEISNYKAGEFSYPSRTTKALRIDTRLSLMEGVKVFCSPIHRWSGPIAVSEGA